MESFDIRRESLPSLSHLRSLVYLRSLPHFPSLLYYHVLSQIFDEDACVNMMSKKKLYLLIK